MKTAIYVVQVYDRSENENYEYEYGCLEHAEEHRTTELAKGNAAEIIEDTNY